MSKESYLEIQEYQANKTKFPRPKIEKDIFDRRLIDQYVVNLSDARLLSFSKERGIPLEILRCHQIGWDGYAYTLPIFHENGFLIGFRRKISGGDTFSKKGSVAGLFNVQWLKSAEHGSIVYICEGEWDSLALEAQGYKFVVGVPGAFTFMKEWLPLFRNKHVILLYDADETGKERSKKVALMLRDISLTVKNIDLSKILVKGKDVRDYFNTK